MARPGRHKETPPCGDIFALFNVAAFVAAFFMFASPAVLAETDVACIEAEAHAEQLIERIPLADRVETLEGDDLVVFLAAFNASEPVSNYQADELIVLGSIFDPMRYLGLLANKGCLVHSGVVAIWIYEKYKRGEPHVSAEPAGWRI